MYGKAVINAIASVVGQSAAVPAMMPDAPDKSVWLDSSDTCRMRGEFTARQQGRHRPLTYAIR